MKLFSILSLTFLTLTSQAHNVADHPQVVLTDAASAKAVGGFVLSEDAELGVATAYLSADQLNRLSSLNHLQGKCAGFEVLNDSEASQPGKVLYDLKMNDRKLSVFKSALAPQIEYNLDYQKLADQASPTELKKTIQWLSSYPTRYHASVNPNQHVYDLKTKLETWLQNAPWPYTIETVAHRSTRQLSLKLTIIGQKFPQEVVVLGGHLDSITSSSSGYPKASAPGADDNASGSSNLIEALKLLTQVKSFERTLEIYWYAGEEAGLLGSAEIAKQSKSDQKNVIGVLQLDMTLFPGSGYQVIGSMTDFTSPALRDLFYQINNLYVKATIAEDKCGYGCSDHASWHRQGYPAVMPFEAKFRQMNRLIHTELDLVSNTSNFDHSNIYTKFAVLFALVLGNSNISVH